MYKLIMYFIGGTIFEATIVSEEALEEFKKKIYNRKLLKEYNNFLEIDGKGLNIANMNAYEIRKIKFEGGTTDE